MMSVYLARPIKGATTESDDVESVPSAKEVVYVLYVAPSPSPFHP